VADPLDVTLGRRDDLLQRVAGQVGNSTPFEVGPQRLGRVQLGGVARQRLHKHQRRWSASGQSWDGYLQDWATEEGLHPGEDILRGQQTRFTREHAADAPYVFADLADTSEAEEQAAIDAGQIQATGIRFTATRT
jgi:hypothetical protein